ncbi:MAG: tetratricopeptide repeat protein [Myxococcota bacterium]|jgi:tetratricopeptide (TPR) repeat protein|nr:tetratricopeptide repeat protein [Myxococcota bacterium]
MSIGRKLLFASVPVVLLWTVLELGLRITGTTTAVERDDPFVGFAGELPLFVEITEPDGHTRLQTATNKRRFFNDQGFDAVKQASTRRVFCLGGSTTYGRPHNDTTSFCGFLRASLPVVAPSTRWEVINAGGISYASYRVAAVADELSAYEPDLLIVYTGHNEFLEERTYHAMRDRPRWLTSLDYRLRGLRSYAALSSLLSAPLATDEEHQRDVLAAEVETRLDRSVGLDAYTRDDALAAKVIRHFQLNLERVIETGRGVGAEVLVVVPAANLTDSSPFKSETNRAQNEAEFEAFYSLLEDGVRAEREGNLEAARQSLASAVDAEPRHAEARYRYGRVLLALGEAERARVELEAARDEDVCPLRARNEIVRSVREIAARHETPTVDFPAILSRHSNGTARPPGADWFLDHVHPTIEGHRVLARELMNELHRVGWLDAGPDAHDVALQRAEAGVRAQVDERALGISLRNLAKVLSWAGKTEEAARSAREALQLLGEDAESYFILSLDAAEVGDHDASVALLLETLRLDPEWVKPRLNLGVQLAARGRLEEAIEAYDRVIELDPKHRSVHFNRANALARLGRMREAAAGYRASLALDPADVEARTRLARIDPSHSTMEPRGLHP